MGIRDRLKSLLRLGSPTHLKAGDPAPELGARDAKGDTWTLAELRGKPAVIYFYPMDDTPGCTKEACSFRDAWARFDGVTLLGVSTDAAPSHGAFAQKYNLPFPLLSDEGGGLSKRWGVLGAMGTPRRVTFVLDAEGRIRKVFDPVSVGGHTDEVLAALA